MKRCSEVMTKNPTCCLADDMVITAAWVMEHENVGSVPVVESQQAKRLIGIVTDRDLALKVVGKGGDSENTRVASVMTPQVVVCHADDNVDDAIDAMADHQLRRIPIVDDNNGLVGIITIADVATRVNKSKKTGETIKEISR